MPLKFCVMLILPNPLYCNECYIYWIPFIIKCDRYKFICRNKLCLVRTQGTDDQGPKPQPVLQIFIQINETFFVNLIQLITVSYPVSISTVTASANSLQIPRSIRSDITEPVIHGALPSSILFQLSIASIMSWDSVIFCPITVFNVA